MTTIHASSRLGARWLGDGNTHFLVWSPAAQRIDVHFPHERRTVPLAKADNGYFAGIVPQTQQGDTYFYVIDDERKRPDPASRFQPQGVHGASQIVDQSFAWTDAGFIPPNLRNTVFYELHIGTVTPEGTFQALIQHLPRLREFGITTLQIMPGAMSGESQLGLRRRTDLCTAKHLWHAC